MRLLALLLIAGVGAAASAWGLNRGGRAARLAALAGIVALFGVTIAAFALRPGRIDAAGEPGTGIFDARLVATSYLRLIVGLWGLEALVLVGAAGLPGGPAPLGGAAPANPCAVGGGAPA